MTHYKGHTTREGLTVDGWGQSLSVPARTAGNERVYGIVVESWISRERKVTVFSRRAVGTAMRETRLTTIDLSEPDQALFKVPADYKIENAPDPNGFVAAGPTPWPQPRGRKSRWFCRSGGRSIGLCCSESGSECCRAARSNQEVRGPTFFRERRERRVGHSATSTLHGYFASSASTSDRTWVPSARTASSAIGLRPNAFSMVGATCRVAARVETVRALKVGFVTSMTTLVSS
jgi:hypothetical protein